MISTNNQVIQVSKYKNIPLHLIPQKVLQRFYDFEKNQVIRHPKHRQEWVQWGLMKGLRNGNKTADEKKIQKKEYDKKRRIERKEAIKRALEIFPYVHYPRENTTIVPFEGTLKEQAKFDDVRMYVENLSTQ